MGERKEGSHQYLRHPMRDVECELAGSCDLYTDKRGRGVWGPRLTTRDTRYAYNSRSQETVVNPHNRVGITDTSSIT
jgi:hypothetical protein